MKKEQLQKELYNLTEEELDHLVESIKAIKSEKSLESDKEYIMSQVEKSIDDKLGDGEYTIIILGHEGSEKIMANTLNAEYGSKELITTISRLIRSFCKVNPSKAKEFSLMFCSTLFDMLMKED